MRVLKSKNLLMSLILMSSLSLTQCGGSLSMSTQDDDTDSNVAEAETQITNATTALTSGDVTSARDAYDAAATAAQAAIAAGSSDFQGFVQTLTGTELLSLLSTSLFGGAFTRTLLLLDSTPIQAIQNSLDLQNASGPARLTLSDLLANGAYLDQHAAYLNDPSIPKVVPEADVSGMPFTGGFLPGVSKRVWALTYAQDGFTFADVQGYFQDMQPLVEKIIDLLAEAALDTGFEFTIPKELYFGDEDIEVSRTDLLFYLAGMQMKRSALSLLNAWTFDIDLGSIYDTSGNLEVTNAALVATMNATFFTIKSTTELSEAQNFLAAFFSTLLDALATVPSSDGFGNIEKDTDTSDLFADFTDAITAAQSSLTGAATIPTTSPLVTLDLNEFFTNPPSADTIGIDPFVLEFGSIKLVEAFADAMVTGVLNGTSVTALSGFSIFGGSTTLTDKQVLNAIFDEFVVFPPFL